MLLRLAYLGVTNALAVLRLLPLIDQAKDAEILALRHQITVLQRQLHGEKVRFDPFDRAFLAALLHRLPATCCGGYDCWCAPRQSCGGTATWSLIATRSLPVPNEPAGPVQCGPFARWCCAWHARTALGDTDASTANCSCWG
jgi:hypothetical protein